VSVFFFPLFEIESGSVAQAGLKVLIFLHQLLMFCHYCIHCYTWLQLAILNPIEKWATELNGNFKKSCSINSQ
jgi:hypothetical protein